ncbi:MAG: phenylalanine--tRNA ligase subunit beta [Bauldia sp.]
MKLPLSWLKEHLETTADVGTISARLTTLGLEVEGIEDKAKSFAGIRVARIVSAVQHPNADRLRVCMVDPGTGTPLQVVCGAPNARTDLVGVFAPAGTLIPGTGARLEKGVIRGVESNGMLLSARELGLSDDHSGIVELPANAPIGAAYATYAGLDDPVIDVAITPNRADCLGVDYIARDLAASGLGTYRNDPVQPIPGNGRCPVKVKLDFGATPSLCPAFALRLIRDVKNGPSPEWLQRRLRAIGLRPINALVDVTNLITFAGARPLHVFDAAKVKGSLTVRRARAGETLLALDGKTYTLDETMCVIADEAGAESLAGIMGGESTGCSDATTDVLIESALWEPLNIAQTGRKLGIVSDARYRFERGVDPAFMLPGLELATRLVMDLCGGTPSEIELAGQVPLARRVVEMPYGEVKRLAGIDPPPQEIAAILTRLGFEVTRDDEARTLRAIVPSWRGDVSIKADLVEEVVRITGVDNVPEAPLPRTAGIAKPVLTLLQQRTRRAKRALAARGLVEAVTWSFIPEAHAVAFGGGKAELKLANPIAADMSDMRPSLLPGLIAAAQRNAARGFGDLALFEVGQIYRGDQPADQFTAAAGIRRGLASAAGTGRSWAGASGVTAFDAKADALTLLAALGVPADRVQVEAGGAPFLHPGRSASLKLGPTALGVFGELHPAALTTLDATGPLVAFEIVLEALPAPKEKATRAKAALKLSEFQPVKRDFAFVVDRATSAAKIVRAAQSADKKLIAEVKVFDVFSGSALGADKKSLAIEVTLQPTEKTLTEAEIEAVGAKIVAEVAKATGATLRA